MSNPFDAVDPPQSANPFDAVDPPQQGGGLPVITDDGSNWDAPQGAAQPGLLSRVGNAIAHPIQTIQDAWNYPGSYIADAAKGMASSTKSAFNLPGDVATGKIDLNDPSQAGPNAARVLSAALLAGPMRASGALERGTPSTEALFAKGGEGFDNWRNSGLQYDPQAASAWATQFQQGLNKDGILPVAAGAPSTHSILDSVANPPPGALQMEPGDLDAIRKSFVNTVGGAGANNTERMAAGRAKSSFLDFLQNTNPTNAPGDAVAGPSAAPSPSDAVGALRDAIANHAAASRSDMLNNLDTNAELQAERSYSGHANGNPIRQNVSSVLRVNPSTGQSLASRSGFNDDEIAALNNAIKGSTARTAGNMAGGGLGHVGALGALLAAKEGYEAGGIPGAITGGSIPFIGAALKGWDKNTTAGKLAAADELVRQRSPLYQSGSTFQPAQWATTPIQSRLVRALMAQQGQGQQQP